MKGGNVLSPMLFSWPELRDYKSEEEGGEELKQDGGEWHGYVRDCKNGLKKCREIWSCFCHGKMTKVQSRKNPLELTDSQKILVREGGRKHMYIVGVRKFSEVTKCFSKFMTRCHLSKQGLDKPLINHAFSDCFAIINFGFILLLLLMQQIRLLFTMVKWEKLVTLKNPFTIVNFYLLW